MLLTLSWAHRVGAAVGMALALTLNGSPSPSGTDGGSERGAGTAVPGGVVWVGEVGVRPAAHLKAAANISAACGVFDDAQKLVRRFSRYRGDARNGHYIPGGKSDLHCGSFENWGYRHVVQNHRSQWETDAGLVGTSWRSHADWAMATVLRDPDRVTHRSSNRTFCYQRVIYLVRRGDGKIVGSRKPIVIVAQASKNIITSFPSNSGCPKNS